MTAKQPAKRFDTPAEATYALRKAVGLPVAEPPKSATAASDRTLWIWITIGAAVAAAVGAMSALLLLGLLPFAEELKPFDSLRSLGAGSRL